MNHNKVPRPDQDSQADSDHAAGALVDGSPRKPNHEYTPQERDALNREAAEKFKEVVDRKFAEVEGREGEITPSRFDREHEQRIRLDPSAFKNLREGEGAVLIRPIPGEEDAAAKKWTHYGGPRVVFSAPGRKEAHFVGSGSSKIATEGFLGPEPSEDIMIEPHVGGDPGAEIDLIREIEAAEPSNAVEAEVAA